MALYETIITNVVHDSMCWCLDEIFFLLITIFVPRYSLGGKNFGFPQISSLAFKIHPPMQPKIASISLPLLPRNTLQKILPLAVKQ